MNLSALWEAAESYPECRRTVKTTTGCRDGTRGLDVPGGPRVSMVYAGRLMSRVREDGPWIRRWLPLTSSAVMTLLGLGIAVQAVTPWMAR